MSVVREAVQAEGLEADQEAVEVREGEEVTVVEEELIREVSKGTGQRNIRTAYLVMEVALVVEEYGHIRLEQASVMMHQSFQGIYRLERAVD